MLKFTNKILIYFILFIFCSAHSPWSSYLNYRAKHLLIMSVKTDAPTYPFSELLIKYINKELPEAQSKPARAKDFERVQSLFSTNQMPLVLLSKQNAKDLGSKLDSTFLEKLGYSAQRFPGLTLGMEGTSVVGASIGAGLSEAAAPGDNFNRLISEVLGGSLGPTVLMGFAPAIFTGAKNLSKYSYIRSKYLIHNRIYLSCPIRNYIFKKSGGNKVITIQSHIIESTISSYSDLDHLLSFGKSYETKSKLLRLGGKINKIKPIGSLRMEYELNQKRKIEKNKKIDILILGVNPTKWIDTSNKIKDGYYIFLKWMVEISKLNPDLNIEYKHHETFKGDKIEERIFMNSKIKKSIYGDKNLSSYDYLLNSSIAFSYCSTMVLEAQALKKIAFFVDPNDVATTFFSHLPSLKKLRINNFKELKKIIKRNIYKKDFDSVFEASDVICLGSKNVTKNLLNYLKN